MMRRPACRLLASAALLTIAAAPAPAPIPFAATLAETAMPAFAERGAMARAWRDVARSDAATRQSRRWALATAMIGNGRGSDAIGVLETMHRSENALELVPAWQLAMGIAQGQANHATTAAQWLDRPALARHPLACAWRVRLDPRGGETGAQAIRCAIPALLAMRAGERQAFIAPLADLLLDTGSPQAALALVRPLPDRLPAANLVRGRAMLALGQREQSRLLLERVRVSGTPEERAASELALLADDIAGHKLNPRQAMQAIDALTLHWRGGPVERGALTLKAKVALARQDAPAALIAQASLFRYFDLGAASGPVLDAVQTQLAAMIDNPRFDLATVAGLFWEYRDLAPSGAEGDRLVSKLADRLAGAGLFERGAQLLRYQMATRAVDIAKGPLSIRAARLLLQAAKPADALATLRQSEGPAYPAAMADTRRQLQAIALYRLGQPAQALAILDALTDAAPLHAELLWQARDWKRFASVNGGGIASPGLPVPRRSLMVLRQAIALSMLGDERGLMQLRQRYAPLLAASPAGKALAALATSSGQVDGAALDRALASLPAAPEADLDLIAG